MQNPIILAAALAAFLIGAEAATKYTTTSVSYEYHTLPTSDCGAFKTVASNYAHCSAGCKPLQVPGAFGAAKAKSPYVCSARPTVETTKFTKTKTVTCPTHETVREITPAYGAVWLKCTS